MTFIPRMQGCFNIRNCAKICHHTYILKEKNHVASWLPCVLLGTYIHRVAGWQGRKVSWGSPGRNDLAVKVGPKVTEVLSEVLDLSNLIAVWVSAIRQPITGLATALGERRLFEYSAHSGRSIHTWLASTTNLGNRGNSASENDKGSSMQNSRTLPPSGFRVATHRSLMADKRWRSGDEKVLGKKQRGY